MKRRVMIGLLVLAGVAGIGLTEAATENPRSTSALEHIERLNPHLSRDDPREFPLKIRTLLRDEYFFFRGTTDLFLRWVKEHARDWFADARTTVLLHGDVHLGNVGTFQTTGVRGVDLGFGLVDPDELFEGPFQLDLLRAATALRVAAASGKIAANEEVFASAFARMTATYREALTSTDGSAAPRDDFIAGFIKSARKASLAEYVEKYVDLTPEPRFRLCRMKGTRPTDLMEPLDEAARSNVASAVWTSFQADENRATTVFGITTRAALDDAMRDVVRWTRTESSGSQGLHKYLVLLDRRVEGGKEELLVLELKEQPPPAAVRAGLAPSVGPAGRAGEVATGYRSMCEPDPWFVSHARLEAREFLVRLRDPWGEELSDGMVRATDDIARFAALLGGVIGQAHRQTLGDRSEGDARCSAILRAVDDLDGVLTRLSREVEHYIRESYLSMSADARARQYVERADDFLKTACDR